MSTILIILVLFISVKGQTGTSPQIEIFDLTNPTSWNDLSEFYKDILALRTRKICFSCGFPKMGTTIHYLYYGTNPVKPATISPNNLMTRLVVIDLSSYVKTSPNFVLQMDFAKRWLSSERETFRPTLMLFKFGWTKHPAYSHNTQCLCQIPGISFEVAAHISINLGHVIGVGTDTPSLESWETRNTPTKTVSGLLGKSGIYILENVDMTSNIPEKGCLAIVMPLKLSSEIYVPARLTAVCPPQHKETVEIILTQADARVE